MSLSRRSFVHTLGFGVAAAVGASGRIWSFEPSRDRRPGGTILLNSNENAYGPSEPVIASMRDALARANRYPGEPCDELVHSIANLHRVQESQILLGCGSTEVLRVSANALLGPEKRLVVAQPTFEAM